MDYYYIAPLKAPVTQKSHRFTLVLYIIFIFLYLINAYLLALECSKISITTSSIAKII